MANYNVCIWNKEPKRSGIQGANNDNANLADSLAAGLDYPVTSRRLAPGELALAIDTDALTMRLVEALSARDDVAYAQPNFQVQFD